MTLPASQTRKGVSGRRVLNIKAAFILGVVAFVMMFGLRKLHSRQFAITRQFIRDQGFEAADRNDYQTATTLLSQYLSMRSGDVEVREKLSEILMEHIGNAAALERAFRLNEDLLRDTVPQPDLRLRQAKLAVRLRKFSDADAHLKILQTSLPDLSDVWFLTGQTKEAMRHTEEAIKAYEQAIRCESPVPAAFESLARLQEENRTTDFRASELMTEMLQRCDNVESLMIHAQWLMKNEEFDQAAIDLEKAIDKSPNDLRANALLIQCLQQMKPSENRSGLLARAADHLHLHSEANPELPQYVVYAAAVHWMKQDHTQAIGLLEEAIRRLPREYVLHRTLIEYHLSNNDPEQASKVLKQTPSGAFLRSETEFLMGRIHMARGDLDAADACLNRAIAFCPEKSPLLPRVQLALAICQRQQGQDVHAVEAYRDVMTRDPGSAAGRLGMAAVFLESGQTDLAIAEYQELLDEPGVPAYLTNLIIQRNLQLPTSIRKWKVAEQLVQDEKPRIEDIVQRRLLQADLKLAQGEILTAYRLLEDAVRQFPDRGELQRALGRLNGEHSAALETRFEELLRSNPDNVEVHAALVRMALHRNQSELALKRLAEIAGTSSEPTLIQRTIRTVQVLRSLCDEETMQKHAEMLNTFQLLQLERMVQLSPDELTTLIRELQLQGKSSAALERLRTSVNEIPSDIVSISCLEYVRFSPEGTSVPAELWELMVQLIAAEPQNAELRKTYAESLLYANQTDVALATLQQLMTTNNNDAGAKGRAAWIYLVKGDLTEARRLLNLAAQLDPNNHFVRIADCRLLIEERHYDECLKKLEDLEQQFPDQSVVSAYGAVVLRALERNDEAAAAAKRTIELHRTDPLLPQDRVFQ